MENVFVAILEPFLRTFEWCVFSAESGNILFYQCIGTYKDLYLTIIILIKMMCNLMRYSGTTIVMIYRWWSEIFCLPYLVQAQLHEEPVQGSIWFTGDHYHRICYGLLWHPVAQGARWIPRRQDAGSGRHCTHKSKLPLVNFILFWTNFILKEIVFPWYFLRTFYFLHNL